MENKFKIVKERTHLFAPSINVITKVDIDGVLTVDDLKQAIEEAVKHNEILSCKIELDKHGVAYYVPQRSPYLFINVLNYESDDNWKVIARNQESIPFDLQNGELIRFFILKNTLKTQLLIIAHHLAGDGLSFAYLIQDIMLALTNKDSLVTKPLKLYDINSLPQNSKLNFIMKLMSKRVNKKWLKEGKTFSFDEYHDMFKNYWKNRQTEILSVNINKQLLEALICNSKKYNVTLNSIIATAFFKSICQKSNLGLTVNVRPNGYIGMGNYATGISIDYKYNNSLSFFENAKNIQVLIYKKLNSNKSKYFLTQFMASIEQTLIDATYFSTFSDFNNKIASSISKMFGYSNKPQGRTISNLTKLKIQSSYENYKIHDYVCVPPIVPNTNMMIGVATLEKEMTICLHIEKNKDFNITQKIFESVVNILSTTNNLN